jgi:cbb3-type cytochrome oxidase subunit 3
MWKSWYVGNSFTDIALVAMVIFMAIFVGVVIRAFATKRRVHDAHAQLPLLDDVHERRADAAAPRSNLSQLTPAAGGTHV